MNAHYSLLFPNALSVERLGQEHASLESFRQAVHDDDESNNNDNNTNNGGSNNNNIQSRRTKQQQQQKEYSLVVVMEPQTQRILLGKKHRGFGAGFYNSFGGKIEAGETDAQSAVRELEEETGIRLTLSSLSLSSVSSSHSPSSSSVQDEEFDMAQHKVGTMHFTFQDSDTEMVVHVFCIHVSCHVNNDNDNKDITIISNKTAQSSSGNSIQMIHLDPSVIRGCDEISPFWFDNWYDIPLHNMFADDSIWLTRLLSHHHQHYHHHQDGDYNNDDNNNNSNTSRLLTMNGWFHFAAGGQEENRILHHYLNVRTHDSHNSLSTGNGMKHQQSTDTRNETITTTNGNNTSTSIPSCSNKKSGGDSTTGSSPPFTLEKRLFHTLHDNQIHSPSIKEFKESWAFCNAVRSFMLLGNNNNNKEAAYYYEQDSSSSSSSSSVIDLVIDVAGGHGALAALFLILTSAQRAVVLDPAQVGGGGVVRAWSDFFNNKKGNNSKTLEYRHECLRTGLPAVLKTAILDKGIAPRNILVVACHACQHLSDEVLAIACGRFGVHAAVMPCCQKDSNGYWKSVAKKMNVPVAIVMDILLAGKASTWPVNSGQHGYDVRIKVLDQSITPQNRLILCRAMSNSPSSTISTIMLPNDNDISRNATIDKAHEKLERAYRRAHDNIQRKEDEKTDLMSFAIVAATNAVHDLLTLAIQQKQQLSMLITGFCLGVLVANTLVTRSDRAG